MATYTLNPNADAAPDAGDWSLQSGTDIWDLINQASGYIYTSTTGKDFRVDFLSQALAGNETIDSVQACIKAHTGNTRSETAVLRVDVENGGLSNADYFTDNHTITENGGSAATYCSAAEPYSTGTTAWTQSDIDGIRIMGEVTSFSGGAPTCVFYQAYITVETTITIPKVLTINSPLTVNGKLTIK